MVKFAALGCSFYNVPLRYRLTKPQPHKWFWYHFCLIGPFFLLSILREQQEQVTNPKIWATPRCQDPCLKIFTISNTTNVISRLITNNSEILESLKSFWDLWFSRRPLSSIQHTSGESTPVVQPLPLFPPHMKKKLLQPNGQLRKMGTWVAPLKGLIG